MTNKKPTDEFLEKLATSRVYPLDRGYIIVGDDLVAMARELQERRKADGAVPVAWSAKDVRDGEQSLYSLIDDVNAALSDNQWLEITPLYTVPQPAPVIPDEIEPDSNNTYDYVDGWNACRAAMLKGGAK
ncbi:hypothetical protein [Citrobacter freundii]|uniref:hypothetical protein n=1 Tax=Citrobacter freundii TaxID=546 RepID=UPI001BCE9546|nr:hypothetical protein [Citrobacter freundii]